MKHITLLLATCTMLATAEAKTHEWRPQRSNDLQNLQVSATVAPGDSILLFDTYRMVQLRGIHGTKEKPVRIIAANAVQIGVGSTNYGLIAEGEYFEVLGMGRLLIYNPAYCMNTGIATGKSSDIKLDGLTIRFCHVGWQANPDSSGVLRNYVFTNNTIHEIRGARTGGRSEAVYVGQTKYANYGACKLEGLLVENCRFYDLDGDGLQVALTTGLVVRNLIVEDYGKANVNWQNVGVILGGGTAGSLTNITIRNGRGVGLQVYGRDTVRLDSLLISKVATNPTDDGIYIERKFTPPGSLVVLMKNVSIDTAARNGITNINASFVQMQGVTIGNVTGLKTSGSNFVIVVPPPPIPVPIDTPKAPVPLFILMSDSTWRKA